MHYDSDKIFYSQVTISWEMFHYYGCWLTSFLATAFRKSLYFKIRIQQSLLHIFVIKSKGKVHPCTGTEALYRPYGP